MSYVTSVPFYVWFLVAAACFMAVLLIRGKLGGRFLRKKWSTYVGFAIAASAAYMAQPTLGAFVDMFVIIPSLICLLIWLAHHEALQ